jgi:hypothetical protein
MRARVGRSALTAYLASAVVGIALAVHGTITDHAVTYRAGVVVLLLGLAGIIDARSRINTERLVEHATEVGRLSLRERQSFAEMGFKAALLSVDRKPAPTGGAEIHQFPSDRRAPHGMRRDGSAS